MGARLIVAAFCMLALSVSHGWARKAPRSRLEVETAQGVKSDLTLEEAQQLYGAEKLHPRLALPGTDRDLKWDNTVAGLDLENADKYIFYRKRGGTSVGFKVGKAGKKKNGKRKRKSGMFMPLNTSAIPEPEVTSYRVARLLQVSHLFNPATYYILGPEATYRFKKLLRRRESDSIRQNNSDILRRKLRRNDGTLFGIYKFRPKRRSQAVWSMVWKNKFSSSHFLAKALIASRAQPSEELVKLRGVTRDKKKYKRPRASKRELARQLSSIFIVDLLIGQWDRFSGTNLEALAHKDGRLQFIARDNGGGESSEDWEWYRYYLRIVSRFDRKLIERMKQLNDFYQGRRKEFSGFTDPKDLRPALGFRTAKSYQNFVKRLQDFMEKRLPRLQEKYGDKIYFTDCTKHCQS